MACRRPRRCHAHTSSARVFSLVNVASVTLQSGEPSQQSKNIALSELHASMHVLFPIQIQPTFSSPSIELEDKVKGFSCKTDTPRRRAVVHHHETTIESEPVSGSLARHEVRTQHSTLRAS